MLFSRQINWDGSSRNVACVSSTFLPVQNGIMLIGFGIDTIQSKTRYRTGSRLWKCGWFAVWHTQMGIRLLYMLSKRVPVLEWMEVIPPSLYREAGYTQWGMQTLWILRTDLSVPLLQTPLEDATLEIIKCQPFWTATLMASQPFILLHHHALVIYLSFSLSPVYSQCWDGSLV